MGIAHALTSGSTPCAGPCARMTTVIALLLLNLGIVYADIPKAGGFEGSAPKPTPPRDHIPPGGVARFRPPQGLGIARTRRLGIYPASLAFVPQESAPALRESWGRSGVEVPGGGRHHSDVGSRSADPIKFRVKSGLF
jgi:hypothetical protein